MKYLASFILLIFSNFVQAGSIKYADFKPVGGTIYGHTTSVINGITYEGFKHFQFHCSKFLEEKCLEIQPVIHTYSKKNGVDTNNHIIYESDYHFPRRLPYSFLENASAALRNEDFLYEYNLDLMNLIRKEKDFACWMCWTKEEIQNTPELPVWALIIYIPLITVPKFLIIAPIDVVTYAATYHIKQKKYLAKMHEWNNHFLSVADNLFKKDGSMEIKNSNYYIENLWFKNANMLIKYLDEGEF